MAIIRIEKPYGLSFQAGQYALLSPDAHENSPNTRPYSIASATHEPYLEFHLKAGPINTDNPSPTSQWVHHGHINDTLYIHGVKGEAVLSANQEKPLLFIAGGVGLAPIKSILDDAKTPIRGLLLWAVRTQADFYGLDWLESLTVKHPALKIMRVTETGDPNSVLGRADTVLADHVLNTLPPSHPFVFGPPAMAFAVIDVLKRHGYSEHAIACDYIDKTHTRAV